MLDTAQLREDSLERIAQAAQPLFQALLDIAPGLRETA
jgi:hypothetical protein